MAVRSLASSAGLCFIVTGSSSGLERNIIIDQRGLRRSGKQDIFCFLNNPK